MLQALLDVFLLHLDFGTIEPIANLIVDSSYATVTIAVVLDHHLDLEQFDWAQLQ